MARLTKQVALMAISSIAFLLLFMEIPTAKAEAVQSNLTLNNTNASVLIGTPLELMEVPFDTLEDAETILATSMFPVTSQPANSSLVLVKFPANSVNDSNLNELISNDSSTVTQTVALSNLELSTLPVLAKEEPSSVGVAFQTTKESGDYFSKFIVASSETLSSENPNEIKDGESAVLENGDKTGPESGDLDDNLQADNSISGKSGKRKSKPLDMSCSQHSDCLSKLGDKSTCHPTLKTCNCPIGYTKNKLSTFCRVHSCRSESDCNHRTDIIESKLRCYKRACECDWGEPNETGYKCHFKTWIIVVISVSVGLPVLCGIGYIVSILCYASSASNSKSTANKVAAGQAYQGQSSQVQPYQAQPYQAQPYQAQPYQAQPYQAQLYQAQPYQAQPTQVLPNQVQPYKAIPSQVQPSTSYPNKSNLGKSSLGKVA